MLSRKGRQPRKVVRKMNKKLLKTMTVGLVCLAICGTSLAAPGKPNNRAPQRVPTRQQMPAPRNERPRRAPTRHDNTRRIAQPKPAPRPTSAAPRRPAPPPPPERHHSNHSSEADGRLALGAAVLGGIVGGLLGTDN